MDNTYLTSSKSIRMSSSFSKSAFKIVGGAGRENPWPTTNTPECWKVLKTARPRKPLAPVTRTVDVIVDVVM